MPRRSSKASSEGWAASPSRRGGLPPSEAGSSSVELAILLPLVWLIVWGGFQLTWTLEAYATLDSATQLAARAAAIAGGRDGVFDRIAADNLRGGGLDPARAEIAVARDAAGGLPAPAGSVPWGSPLYVSIRYPWKLQIPFLLEEEITLARTVAVRSESD